MMMSQVADALDAKLLGHDVMMTGVSKDTRDIQAGDLYVALVGDRFDGHQFITSAGTAGAAGALVSKLQEGIETEAAFDVIAGVTAFSLPQVQVNDTRLALGQLAAHWRQLWGRQSRGGQSLGGQSLAQQETAGKLIGITGSNGKTSVKEMCRKILLDHAGLNAVLATKGNMNNDIGMPMMLLELRQQHQFAVIEMGANHSAEIDYLTKIARPDVALVNNVGPAHLEGFGSLQDIATAKAEIYLGLSEHGVAIINLDDNYAAFWQEDCVLHCSAKKVIGFSMLDEKAEIYAKFISESCYQIFAFGEQAELSLKVPGKHNVMNALAAIAATLSVGVSLKAALASLSDFENIQGRLTSRKSKVGFRVIDDTYNANPLSVSVAIDVLAEMQNSETDKTVLVLGDMAELGDDAWQLHEAVGEKARVSGIQALYATGKNCKAAVSAFGSNGYWFKNKSELINRLIENLAGSEVVLIKGSRSAAMEEVVEQLLGHERSPVTDLNKTAKEALSKNNKRQS